MRFAALQIEHHFGDPGAALRQIDAFLEGAGPLDLVLLPEACLTGYVSPTGNFDLSPQAEPLDGPSAQALAGLARKFHTTLAGPLIEREGRRVFNSFLVFGPDGTRIAHYRKRHPWFPERWATAGTLPYPRFQLDGLTCTLAICFDVHFLEEENSAPLQGADLLLFPSAWVDGRAPEDTRAELLPGMATRQGLTILNANWARSRPHLPGQGGSRIVGPRGQHLASPLGEAVGLIVAEITAAPR